MKKIISLSIFIGIIILNLTACNSRSSQTETYDCTISIDCRTVLENMQDLTKEKKEIIPSDGVILKETDTTFSAGETAYDVLKRVCRDEHILLEVSFTPGTGSAYVEGIANLYEFDCGDLSGWQFCVNGEYISEGCSEYKINPNDNIAWRYTCDMGGDLK